MTVKTEARTLRIETTKRVTVMRLGSCSRQHLPPLGGMSDWSVHSAATNQWSLSPALQLTELSAYMRKC